LRKTYKIFLIFFLVCLIPQLSVGKYFFSGSSYEVCFTPHSDCAQLITTAIAQAKEQILVQAYLFTDRLIAKALVAAKKNGVDVQMILDESQIKDYAIINFLNKNKIKAVIVDYSPNIAHNKVMIIDKAIIITGSYNYTMGARKNAENILIIKDTGLAHEYIRNWQACNKVLKIKDVNYASF
jgi:phosphatidylserine/phosphatidylglycerophosphate/cardiolipin synthase-like enzyme